MKLSTELSKVATGRTFYVLDEPTTGLHFEDTKMLLGALNKLVDWGDCSGSAKIGHVRALCYDMVLGDWSWRQERRMSGKRDVPRLRWPRRNGRGVSGSNCHPAKRVSAWSLNVSELFDDVHCPNPAEPIQFIRDGSNAGQAHF